MLPPDRGLVRASARAAVLADWMSSWLDERAHVSIATSYRELALAVERREVDLAWAPPAVCAKLRALARTMLTVVRYGATSCRAALVVRAGSGIRSLEDLAGKRAAWVDPLSTSGHLMALVHLREHGLDRRGLFIEERFAGSYRDALLQVADGKADVTSVFVVADGSAPTLNELEDLVGPKARALELLCTTAPAPYDALMIPAHTLDANALERKLLALDQRMSPPAMLLEVCRADRFVRANVEEYSRFDEVIDPILFE